MWSLISEEVYQEKTSSNLAHLQVDGPVPSPESLTPQTPEREGNNEEKDEFSEESPQWDHLADQWERNLDVSREEIDPLNTALQPRELFGPYSSHRRYNPQTRRNFLNPQNPSEVETNKVNDLSKVLNPVEPLVPEAVVCDRVQRLENVLPNKEDVVKKKKKEKGDERRK